MVRDSAGEEGDCRLRRQNVDFKSKIRGGLCGNVSKTSDRHFSEHSAQVLGIEEPGKILNGRRTGEGYTVSTSRKQRRHPPAIKILRQRGAINRNYVDARAGRF